MPSPTNQVQLTIVEDVLGELIVLEAPAAQIAIGPQLSDTAPVALGTAAAGTASSAARGDHVHAHGNLSGSSLHALASTSAAGFMSTAQFDLLAAATDDDDASTLVKRDSLGNFSAGTITADLTGNASTATKLSSTRTFAVTGDITGNVSSDLTAGASITTAIAEGVVVNADINASAAIAHSKLANITAGQVLLGNASNVPTATALTGDVTVNNTGVTAISAGVIVDADINANAEIAVAKLADGAARQLLQTAANGTDVEWASNIDIPGTLDVTGAATFDGAVTIEGDLTVNGTETIINTQTLDVEDKNIVIGKVDTPTDTTADGGGITLKGTTDKTINWVDATDAWTFSEHIDLASTKEYRIAGTKVLDATSLGSAVVTSSLTSVGTISTGVWQGTAIDKTYLDATLVSTGDTGTVTSTMIADGTIVDADINASAAIVDTKLATISTAGKVSNSATTADSANTASAIVARDASGNFSAGTITAALTGAASANVLKAGDTMTGALLHPLGTAAAPSIAFTGDTNTGIYSPGADQVAVATNGAERLRITSAGSLLVGTTTTPTGAGSGAVVAQDRMVISSAGAGRHQVIVGDTGAMTATTGTTVFRFKNGLAATARSCYVKLAIANRVQNDTPSNLPAAEYAFQLHSTTADVCSLNGATTIFEFTYVYATHVAFADLGSGECTVTLTNPTALSQGGSYKVEVLTQAGAWTLDSVTTT
jgi:cytoskeletal protein CcmA (bactofilin family)